MFNVKLIFKSSDQDKIVESWARSFSEALFHSEYALASTTQKPVSIDIFEDNKIVASLRTVR